MSISIYFSEARPLEKLYERNLLEDYNYKSSKKGSWFSPITRYFKIMKVEEINNPHLHGMYLLWEEELRTSNLYAKGKLKKQILYHATSPANAMSIARNNIDWRRTKRCRFGMGACFSNCPKYAHKFASSQGAMVIFEVLTKNIQRVNVSYSLRVPTKKEYDTTLSSNRKVYVKYDDYQFNPKFIVYYYY